jgi:hypothetical protein
MLSSTQKNYWQNLGFKHAIKSRRPIFYIENNDIDSIYPNFRHNFINDKDIITAGTLYLEGYKRGRRSRRNRY